MNRHLKPRKLIEKQRVRIFKKTIVLFLVIGLGIGLITTLSRVNEINIKEVRVEGNSIVSETDILDVVKSELDGHYGFLFPKTNILIYPRTDITSSVLETYKYIKSINLETQDLQKINVVVEERKPFALWCDVLYSEEETCYFLDEEGFIFSLAPTFTGNVFVKYYGEVLGIVDNSPIGHQFLSKENFFGLTFILEEMENIDLIAEALIVDGNNVEIFVENGSQVLFKLDQNPLTVSDNLGAVLDSSTLGEEDLELDYIDLRFGNKVYYKLR